MVEKFQVTDKKDEKHVVLYTDGYINNLGGDEIAKRCYALIEEGYRHFVLNLERSKIVNSIGISILIEIIEKVIEIQGSLSFCGLTPTIAKTFRIMGLAQYARIYETESEAVAGLSAA
jgi:anti-anti-sigma factor